MADPLPLVGRVAHLAALGVRVFSALAYPHKPGMAADLNDWTLAFARDTPGCLPSATFHPEPEVRMDWPEAEDDPTDDAASAAPLPWLDTG